MKRLFLKVIEKVFSALSSKKRFYSFFYFLYLQGLKGMDHGYSYIYPESSGEFDLLYRIARFYNNKKITFFDVGANTGYYSRKVLEIFNQSIDIYCFEPSTFTLLKLKDNLGERVRTFQLALSNKRGAATLHSDKDGSGMASLEDTTFAPPYGISTPIDEPVNTETLDHFCEVHSIYKIHFLKMDVEGHEYAILEGAIQKLQQRAIDFIQFEFGRVNIDSNSPLKKFYKLLSRDYYIYRIIRNGLIPQFEYNYEYEIYLGTNFLAVSKFLNDKELKSALGL